MDMIKIMNELSNKHIIDSIFRVIHDNYDKNVIINGTEHNWWIKFHYIINIDDIIKKYNNTLKIEHPNINRSSYYVIKLINASVLNEIRLDKHFTVFYMSEKHNICAEETCLFDLFDIIIENNEIIKNRYKSKHL